MCAMTMWALYQLPVLSVARVCCIALCGRGVKTGETG